MRAVALLGIVEEREAARFPCRQLGLAVEPGVILAAVGKELGVTLLIGLERLQDAVEGAVGIGEDAFAEGAAQQVRMRRPPHRLDHRRRAVVRHLQGESSGSRAWSRPRSTRPSQVRPPVGPLSTLASPSSSESRKCSVNAGVACRYRSEGTARSPLWRMSLPPGMTARSPGGPKARAGSWQDAQASRPEAESVGSKNSRRPSSASRFTCA